MDTVSRRDFLAAGTAMLTARAYSRIRGANDRIQIGQIGCGNRAVGHRQMLKLSSQQIPISICAASAISGRSIASGPPMTRSSFRIAAQDVQYSEELLADPQLDAVMIATGDHQHARILAEVVRAGKDCYCEKPMANTLEDAKLAREAVLKATASCRWARSG